VVGGGVRHSLGGIGTEAGLSRVELGIVECAAWPDCDAEKEWR
jgi:hypothetical protein